MIPGGRLNQHGFSLLGLMVGLLLVAILTAIAVPNYQQSLAKTRRSSAQGALLILAQHMQRVYSENGSFMPAGDAPSLPLDRPEVAAVAQFYNFSLASVSSQEYVLRASPRDVQADDGNLEVTHTGQRRWDADNSGSITDAEQHWPTGG